MHVQLPAAVFKPQSEGQGRCWDSVALVNLVSLEGGGGLLSLLALKQRPKGYELCKDAARCPDINCRRVVLGS